MIRPASLAIWTETEILESNVPGFWEISTIVSSIKLLELVFAKPLLALAKYFKEVCFFPFALQKFPGKTLHTLLGDESGFYLQALLSGGCGLSGSTFLFPILRPKSVLSNR